MATSGRGLRKVLIVAEAPGRDEDRQGQALVGAAGLKLSGILRSLGVDMRRDCWLENAIICRPTWPGGDNRTPDEKEERWCRPHLAKVIKDLNPEVIIPLGLYGTRAVISLAWRPDEVDGIKRWVGWRIPSCQWNTWICPSYHPSYLLRTDNAAAYLHVANHLKNAFELDGRPWDTPPDWQRYVRPVMDDAEAASLVEALDREGEPLAFDYETTTLKPDGPAARILCCSVSNGDTSVAFPWRGEVLRVMRRLLCESRTPKIAANLRFEERWTRKFFRHGVTPWLWDTMLAAHWLDCRGGICSLKFQAFVHFGAPDYDSHLEGFRANHENDSNGPNRLHEVEVQKLLVYCGLDSLFEAMLARIQRGR
jgi:uracil-DNA glycosylase family 4